MNIPIAITGDELLLLGLRALRNMYYSNYRQLCKDWKTDVESVSEVIQALEVVNACDLLIEKIEKEIDLLTPEFLEKEN